MSARALAELTEAVPPPPAAAARPVDWTAVEAEIGTALPSDYKELVERYGPGWFDEFLWILHPTTPDPYLNLREQIRVRLDALRESLEVKRELDLEPAPYPLFPEPGGILPWGFTGNGDVCYWRTSPADPDRWTVVLASRDLVDWVDFPGTLTECLVSLLLHPEPLPLFPADFPSEHPVFAPAENTEGAD